MHTNSFNQPEISYPYRSELRHIWSSVDCNMKCDSDFDAGLKGVGYSELLHRNLYNLSHGKVPITLPGLTRSLLPVRRYYDCVILNLQNEIAERQALSDSAIQKVTPLFKAVTNLEVADLHRNSEQRILANKNRIRGLDDVVTSINFVLGNPALAGPMLRSVN